MYLWNGRVHASDTRRMLEVNTRRGGIKRLMEEPCPYQHSHGKLRGRNPRGAEEDSAQSLDCSGPNGERRPIALQTTTG